MKEVVAKLDELNVVEDLMAVHKKQADKGMVFQQNIDSFKELFEKNKVLENQR